jgi:hypothetical protein
VPEAKDEFCILTMVGIEGVVFGCMIEVVEVGWGCFGDAIARTEALASAPVGAGSRWCTAAL